METPAPALTEPVVLGRTGLTVGRLGIAAGYGVPGAALEAALDRGQNLFYWGSLRRRGFGEALGELARRRREQMVIAVASYSRSGWLLRRSVEHALRRLRIDVADLLILGYWSDQPSSAVLDAALELKARGCVRGLVVSCHRQESFERYLGMGCFDAFMVRYNAAHRGAERAVFGKFTEANRPGILTFTSTYWGRLLRPGLMPPGIAPPTAGECYRFALAQPKVDAVLAGPANPAQLNEALEALDAGPLEPERRIELCLIGEHLRREHPAFFYERF
jgi:aryl-alcohol dehydrogenase-like predicted oxidoreductase